jgi:hypothetical protein
MTTQTELPNPLPLEERVTAIEHKQLRFMRMWIATHLTSSTSTPTGQTGPTSTATTANSPTTARASRRLSPASIWRHARQHMPKLLGWLLEKAAQYLLPVLVSGAMAGWAFMRRYGEALWDWCAGWWHFVLQLLHVGAS